MTKSNNKRTNKRTKEQASPGSSSDQPDKIQIMSEKTPPAVSAGPGMPCTPLNSVQGNSPVMLTPNQQMFGQYYPPHLQYMFQQPPSPASIHLAQPAAVPSATQDQGSIQAIFARLSSIDNRLAKLDRIEMDVSKIAKNVTLVEARMNDIDTKYSEVTTRLLELETSRAFDSSECDDLRRKHSVLEKSLNSEKSKPDALSRDLNDLKQFNSTLADDVVQLKAHSMRDNLLFLNFAEENSFDDRRDEDCMSKVLSFCENELGMNDARVIKIDRAHRVGRFEQGSKRPIVAKFNFHQDKLTVKQNAYDKLKHSACHVSDQYHREIQERRRKLLPYLVQARSQNKQASLSVDKLFIGKKLYTADSLPPGPPPDLPPRGGSNFRNGNRTEPIQQRGSRNSAPSVPLNPPTDHQGRAIDTSGTAE